MKTIKITGLVTSKKNRKIIEKITKEDLLDAMYIDLSERISKKDLELVYKIVAMEIVLTLGLEEDK